MTRPSAGGLIRFAVAAGLTVFIFWKSRPAEVLGAAAAADWRWIAAAAALVIVDRALMAYRWLVLLCPLPASDRPPFRDVMRIFFVSTFVGTFLPASVGGDAVRAVALSRLDVPPALSVASVFMDRMLGVLSILLMAGVGLVIAQQLATNPIVLASLVVSGAACAVTALAIFDTRSAALLRHVVNLTPIARVRRAAHALLEAVQRYAFHHGALGNVLAGSVGVQVLRIVQAYLLGRGLGIDAAVSAYFAFVPLILLVMLLPITVNGLGTSQAAFVWFFGQAGVPRPEAFALSILFVALGIVGNLPGGALYAWSGALPRDGSGRR